MTLKHITGVTIKDADKGLVTAVISTFGVIDLDGDVTSKASFTDGADVVVSGYGHTSWDGELPLGKGTIRTTDTEAIADLELFLDLPHAAAAFGVIKRLGPLQEWSYSLEKTVSHFGELNGQECRFIDSTFVKEVSPVLRGASIATRTLAVKGEGLKLTEHIDAVVTAVEELITRTADVVTKRAADGKTLGEESRERLARLDAQLAKLRALGEPASTTDPLRDELEREWLRSLALSL